MSHPTEEPLPPLGEPTPARRTRSQGTWWRRSSLVGVVALVLGVLVGFALAQALEGDARHEEASTARSDGETATGAPPTTATAAEVTPECVETIRSAEQAMTLLDQGVQDLRNLHFAELDSRLDELQRLRRAFDGRARRCLERVRRP